MRKKKIIEAAIRQLEKERAWQNTLTVITPDGGLVEGGCCCTLSNEYLRADGVYGIEDIYVDTIIKSSSKKDDSPKEFHPLLCTRCGGNLAFKNNFLVCEYCGTMYSSDLNISEKPQEYYKPKNKCANCGHSINATTLDDSKQVYICGSMNGCIYEEE